jgi:NAD(P)H-quinone oxidoreductase subunit 4
MAAMASLALPGMSGFASEVAVFVGFTTSSAYSETFRTVMVGLSAVGLILTPIYLLSMLRQVFYAAEALPSAILTPFCDINDLDLKNQGNEEPVCFGNNCELPGQSKFEDATFREVMIAACFLVLILAIGFYPKLAMQMYDAKTVAVNASVQEVYQTMAQAETPVYDGKLYAGDLKPGLHSGSCCPWSWAASVPWAAWEAWEAWGVLIPLEPIPLDGLGLSTTSAASVPWPCPA